jgi:hypothetical protein
MIAKKNIYKDGVLIGTITTSDRLIDPPDEYKVIFDSSYGNDQVNLQRALQALKKHDANPIMAIKVVRWKFKISLKEANEMVMTSEAWNGYGSSR